MAEQGTPPTLTTPAETEPPPPADTDGAPATPPPPADHAAQPPAAPPPPTADPTTEPPAAGPARPLWRRRRYRVLAVLGAVVVAVLLAPAALVEPFVDRAVHAYEGRCAEFTGVEIDSGSWPVVGRAALGQLRGVSSHTERIRFDNGFTLHDVDFSADQVNGAPLRFGLVEQDADIRGGESAATVLLADVEDALAAYGGTVELHVEGETLMADAEVPVVGNVPTTVDLVPVDGDLELRFAALDAFDLPPVVIDFPDPIVLQGVELQDEGVRVTSTVDGTMTTQDWGCDAEAG